jgi:hypothetical protein
VGLGWLDVQQLPATTDLNSVVSNAFQKKSMLIVFRNKFATIGAGCCRFTHLAFLKARSSW